MLRLSDTIVAPITGAGPAAVSVVRISGPDAWRIAGCAFDPWPDDPLPRKALYGRFANGDDGLALPFEEGGSYTGEQTVELSVHGSRGSLRSLVRLCIAAGARPAEPGEFTLRAFMSGRIDLSQAESVRDMVEAQTEAQLRAAAALRDGQVSGPVRTVRHDIATLLADVEAHVDFSEELGEFDHARGRASCDQAKAQLADLIECARSSRLVREGVRIAIVGRPNAGKSSLLNALLGADRAIVTDRPGTTRDTVEESADLGGLLCHLVDTAGLTATDDPIERLGVERSRDAISAADLVWYLYDSSLGLAQEDAAAFADLAEPKLLVAAKCDLPGPAGPGLRLSSLTSEGLADLIATVHFAAGMAPSSLPVYVNARHAEALARAAEALEEASGSLTPALPFDLAATHLRTALDALGEITGETASEDMLERLFADFCIGK